MCRKPDREGGQLEPEPVMTRDYIDFQTRTQPLAFLITFRCYGTWLHGDGRGSIDRKNYNRYGTPAMPPNKRLREDERIELKHDPIELDGAMRAVVDSAIRDVCEHRDYVLHAVKVRTNHVHSVVSAPCRPELVMESFTAYATRLLRKAGLLSNDVKPWRDMVVLLICGPKKTFKKRSITLLTAREMSQSVNHTCPL
jgi:REP element-mobilizing transposase RayT